MFEPAAECLKLVHLARDLERFISNILYNVLSLLEKNIPYNLNLNKFLFTLESMYFRERTQCY